MIREVFIQVNVQSITISPGLPEYGSNDRGEGKIVIIEYSSANRAKSFHVGNLRWNTIVVILATLYKLGIVWKVNLINFSAAAVYKCVIHMLFLLFFSHDGL